MYKVVFSPLAIKDLEEVRLHITQELCNEQAAQKILSGIMRDIRRLSQFPESSPLLSSMVDFETDYRFLVCGNYVVFYRFAQEQVHIVRVLYGRRNFMQTLFGEPQE